MRNVLCVLVFLISMMISSCERVKNDNPEKNIPVSILEDFKSRYPNSILLKSESFDDYKTLYIDYNDQNSLVNTTVYLNGDWKLTQTEFDKRNFMNQLPLKVVKAYMEIGIEMDIEQFVRDNNSYVLGISRNGIDKKQYEFYFTAPYRDEAYEIDNLTYTIVIDEDGNLLYNSHQTYNRSIWMVNIDPSIRCVRERYPDAAIIGAVNDGGKIIFFISDNGVIKTVTTHETGKWEWKETSYPINDNDIPQSVLAEADKYEGEHPDVSLYSIHYVETQFGDFYRFTYGDEFSNSSILIKAEKD